MVACRLLIRKVLMNIFAFSEVLYSIGCESAMVFQPCTKPREKEAASCDCTEGRGKKLLVTWGLNILYLDPVAMWLLCALNQQVCTNSVGVH